jgi:two-component system response regulator NreC
MPISVLIADDHGVLRAGLHALLSAEPDLEVVGEAASGEETLRLASELQPDVVLLDISMPDPDGIEVTRQLKEMLPDVHVLILTVHQDRGLLREAIQVGAAGYITKHAAESELIDAIQAVQSGELYIHPAMIHVLVEDQPPPASDEAPEKLLTPREIEVLSLIARGYTNREIAEMLSISVRTVESHRAKLISKLDMRSRVGLVRYARKHGLLE